MQFDLETFTNTRILVVGDVMLDQYWFGDVERVSPEAPVPVVSVKRTTHRPGGAANVANNVVSLGAQCTLLSVVGDDEAGRTLSTLLNNAGIGCQLAVDADIETTIKLRLMSKSNQLIRIDFETPPRHEILSQLLDQYQSALANTDAVIISDYGKGGLVHIEQMINSARDATVPVMVDPKGDNFDRYHNATVITPNKKELEAVIGTWRSDDERNTRIQSVLSTHQIDHMLLTLSDEGMLLCWPNKSFVHAPARAREVYDVTGAGDTVIATYTVALAAGLDHQTAMHMANVAAGIVVSKLGTARVEVSELMAALACEQAV